MPPDLVPLPTRFPKVPLERRTAAFAIDWLTIDILGFLLGGNVFAQFITFMLAWLGMRVILVSKNHGQSLGRWALDMRVADGQARTPELKALAKREGVLGIAAFLAFLGLVSFSPSAPWAPLCFLPLGFDCMFAWFDPDRQQTLHDRLAQTVVAQSRRGYSLDLKLKQLLADVKSRMK